MKIEDRILRLEQAFLVYVAISSGEIDKIAGSAEEVTELKLEWSNIMEDITEQIANSE